MENHQVTRDQVCILIFDKLSSGDFEYDNMDPTDIMRRAQEAKELATDKDTQGISGHDDESYGKVIWSPAADGRGLDGYIPLGNVISNPRVTSTRPPVSAFSAQIAAMLQRRREANDVAPVPEDPGFELDPSPSSFDLKPINQKKKNEAKKRTDKPEERKTTQKKAAWSMYGFYRESKKNALESSFNNGIEKRTLLPEKTKRERACVLV